MNDDAASTLPGDRPPVAIVVATLGRSPWLQRCLDSIATQREQIPHRLCVVQQGRLSPEHQEAVEEHADDIVALDEPIGFAAANNRGIARCLEHPTVQWIALVNDDVVLAPGWLAACRRAAETSTAPRVSAVQGINLLAPTQPAATSRIDGLGIGWRGWRAVQLGHGDPADRLPDAERPVFGVSATAALFARSALEEVGHDGAVFDETLDTYYEDVDLACRLRAAGRTALLTPNARCEHLASASAPAHRQRLLVANRHLVLARHAGRRYPALLPRLLVGDLRDFGVRALGGWSRAARRLPRRIHLGPSLSFEAPLT